MEWKYTALCKLLDFLFKNHGCLLIAQDKASEYISFD